jgi:hypothetical protein
MRQHPNRKYAEFLGTCVKIAFVLSIPASIAFAAIVVCAAPFAALMLGAMELKHRSDDVWEEIKAAEHAEEVARMQSSQWAHDHDKAYWKSRQEHRERGLRLGA